MTFGMETLEILLLIAAVVAMLTRKLRVPYSVGLVATGIMLAFFSLQLDITLTKELIFSTLLPPLIFEAAFFLHWKELRRDFWVITTLASVGVVLSAAVTAVGMHYLAGWEWMAALVFGVLIAATDPVSVIATFKETGVKGRLRTLVEAESLFNDGAAAVLFGVVIAMAAGEEITATFISLVLVKTVGGGILCGALVAWLMLLMAGRTQDHLVEITFTTVAAYGSFLLAEHLHLSGVLATLTTGLMMGNLGIKGAISERGREAVEAFWEYIAFVSNSLIFLLIGVREGAAEFFPCLDGHRHRHRAGDDRARGGHLPDMLAVFAQRSAGVLAPPACAGVGRIARCAGFGIGPGIARRHPASRPDHQRGVCRRGVLALCPGLDDGADVAPHGRTSNDWRIEFLPYEIAEISHERKNIFHPHYCQTAQILAGASVQRARRPGQLCRYR